jgi:hypothetical protein
MDKDMATGMANYERLKKGKGIVSQPKYDYPTTIRGGVSRLVSGKPVVTSAEQAAYKKGTGKVRAKKKGK